MAASSQTNTIGGNYTSRGEAVHGPVAVRNRRRACVADLVMEAARSSPEAIALSAGDETMTFGDLAARSARLASYLIALGAGPEVPVGLCLERSFDFIVSALAVLLSGAAYLPLDPTWPAARLRDDPGRRPSSAPHLAWRPRCTRAGNGTRTIDLDTAASRD